MSPESFNPNQPSPDTKDRLVLRSDNTISVMTDSGKLDEKGMHIMYGIDKNGDQITKPVREKMLSSEMQDTLAGELAATLPQPELDDDITHDRGELLASIEAGEHELTPAQAFHVEVGSAAVVLSSIESAPLEPVAAEAVEIPSVDVQAEAAAAQAALETETRAKQELQAKLDDTERTTRQIKAMFDGIRGSIDMIRRGANAASQIEDIAGGITSIRNVASRYRMPNTENGSAEIDARIDDVTRFTQKSLQELQGAQMSFGRSQGAEAFTEAQRTIRKIEESVDAIAATKKRLLGELEAADA